MASNQAVDRIPNEWSSVCEFLSKRLHSMGTKVSATTADTKIAKPTTTANSWNSNPMVPGMKKIGMSTATREMEMEMMVNATSRAPRMAAANAFMPFSMCRAMFSSITMASSTTKPTARVNPSIDTLFKLPSIQYSRDKAPINDTGMEMPGMRVADRRRKNKKMTNITKAIVRARVK